TPVIIGQQIVVHGPRSIDAYDLATGERRWGVTISSSGTSTPVVAGETVYVSTLNPLGEAEQGPQLPGVARLMERYDSDKSGTIRETELPPDLMIFSRPDTPAVPGASMSVRQQFASLDANHDGALDAQEWTTLRDSVKALKTEHGLLAVRTGGPV